MKTGIEITKGSKEQIKWAESIRDEAFKYFNTKIQKMKDRKPEVAQAYNERKKALINHPRANEAIFWIKNNDWMLGRNVAVEDFV